MSVARQSSAAIARAPVSDIWIAIIGVVGCHEYAIARVIWALSRGHYQLRAWYFRAHNLIEVSGRRMELAQPAILCHGWYCAYETRTAIIWCAKSFGYCKERLLIEIDSMREPYSNLNFMLTKHIMWNASREPTHDISFEWGENVRGVVWIFYHKNDWHGDTDRTASHYRLRLENDVVIGDAPRKIRAFAHRLWKEHSVLLDLYNRGLLRVPTGELLLEQSQG
jgi:hypothetical protein